LEGQLPSKLLPYIVIPPDLAKAKLAEMAMNDQYVREEMLHRLIVAAELTPEEQYEAAVSIQRVHISTLLRYVATEAHAKDYFGRIKHGYAEYSSALVSHMWEHKLDTTWLWEAMLKAPSRFEKAIRKMVRSPQRMQALIKVLFSKRSLGKGYLRYLYLRAPTDLLLWALRREKFVLIVGIHRSQSDLKRFELFLKGYTAGIDTYKGGVEMLYNQVTKHFVGTPLLPQDGADENDSITEDEDDDIL
jgi:hypothetical protein